MDEQTKLENTNPSVSTEDQKQVSNQPVEPTVDGKQQNVSSTSDETQPPKGDESNQEENVPIKSDEGNKQDEDISPRAAKRIEKLIEKIRGNQVEPEETPTTTVPKVEPQTPPVPQVPVSQQVDVRRIVEQELAVRDFVSQYNSDQVSVQNDYPVLKEKPELLDTIDALYESTIGYNKKTNTVQRIDISYKEFADAFMEGAGKLASYESSKTAKDVASQASSQAVVGDTSTNTGKKPLSRETIAAMPMEEYRQRRDEINAWAAQNSRR